MSTLKGVMALVQRESRMFPSPKHFSDISELRGGHGAQMTIVLVEDTGAMILDQVRVLADSPVPAVLGALVCAVEEEHVPHLCNSFARRKGQHVL